MLAVALACAALPAAAGNGTDTGAQPASGDEAVVHCFDPKLRIVQRKLAGNCAGEVVSAERAAQIEAEVVERRRRAMEAPRKPTIEGRKLQSVGTGFFVTADGKMLTNNHVVDGCTAVSVGLPDGRRAEAQVLDTAPQHDLALLDAPLEAPAYATFLSDRAPEAGAPVMVIGYPDQGLAPIRPILTPGTLGAPDVATPGGQRFPITADIRGGNSGGPVLDARALVIGVVFAKVNTVAVFKATGRKVRFVGAVIDRPAVFAFLDRNGVPYRVAAAAPEVAPDQFERVLRPLVARVGCWK